MKPAPSGLMLVLRRVVLALLVAQWVFSFTMTHLPRPPRVGLVTSDKLIHFLGYGLLGGLLFLTMWAYRPRMRMLPLIVLGVMLGYAALDELTQPMVGRVCDFKDWLADSAGAGVAVICLGLARWKVGSASADGPEGVR